MTRFLNVLQDRRLRAVIKAIGGRIKRLQTEKKPLLYAVVRDATRRTIERVETGDIGKECPSIGDQTAVRDAFALVFSVCFGTRVSELLSLTGKDISVVRIGDDDSIEVTFLDTKTRSTPFGTHQPFRVMNAHPYLMRAWDAFNAVCGFPTDEPIFVAYGARGGKRASLTRDWFARLVKRIDPECTPHSARSGMATELWAAGASLDDIMSMGRWTSAAAVLYIIGSVDRQVSASKMMGRGMVRYETGRLRQQLALNPDGEPLLRADDRASQRWPGVARKWIAERSAPDVTMGRDL